MHLKSLCFILPTEFDEPEKVTPKESSNRGCGGVVIDHLRRSLRRFFSCHHYAPPWRQFSGVFVDAEGVQVQEKIGSENPRIFSYSELYVATNGFEKNEILGSGGFGRVYRAVLPSDGTVVAVKCLTERGERFEKTFVAELAAVAHLRHRNLVRLRGWSFHDEQLLLVYDYMPNRSLDRVLFKKAESPLLDWDTRKKIVNGLAAALYYLHEKLETQIIHRDVKASNVMLDSNFNARLGDFGLARWLEHDLTYKPKTPPVAKNRQFRLVETTRIGGTIGYLPPESFQKRSTATAKADVFSFGIVVLEVVSGRRAVDLTYPDDRIILLDWIRRLSDEERLVEAGDALLKDRSSKLSEIDLLLRLGLMCTYNEPQSRPSMKWVVEVLSGNIYGKLPDLPSFQTHPLYISLTSSSNSASSNDTGHTKSSRTTSAATTTTTVLYSSDFVSANAETIYVTAESERSSSSIPSSKACGDGKCFSMVETPRVFTYEEIVSATNNFSDSRRVAEVDFGTAYHGFLERGRSHVIVKRLGMKTCPALRMRFANEFKNMGRLRHRNLMQLKGWCTEQGEMLVVYDYTACRLLSHVLFHHGRDACQSRLSWRQRYDVIRSLASAVCYLHEEWDEQVIHRNITSSAIILDQDMNPRLGSFALAEFLTRNETGEHVVIDKKRSVRGIFGYLSPEYVDSGEATTMADVYSFGVVLLEVVTGKMAVDFRQRDVLLVKRVHEFEAKKRAYKDLVDPRLDGEYDERELVRLVKLGLACTRSDQERRPSMKQIVSILDGNDHWLEQTRPRKEGREEWRQRNAPSLCLVKRIQALGVQ